MTKDYSKYYSLEEHLFKEVKNRFQKRGFLTSEEFFCIIIWKANRAKSKILKKLTRRGQKLSDVVKELTSDIANSRNTHERLEVLLSKWRLRLPMATAILTVLYPEGFTVYDVRVCNELGIKDFADSKLQVDKYFQIFLPMVRKVRENKSLRENDKYLWGKSFYKDLISFLKR